MRRYKEKIAPEVNLLLMSPLNGIIMLLEWWSFPIATSPFLKNIPRDYESLLGISTSWLYDLLEVQLFGAS